MYRFFKRCGSELIDKPGWVGILKEKFNELTLEQQDSIRQHTDYYGKFPI